MSAEFYRNAATLFDEFKKRELHYLSIERNSYSTSSWKIHHKSTDDYLKKINERERETEKTYQNIMRNMQELDRHTDQMSLKLEKLNVLRNIAINSYNPSWHSTTDMLDKNSQSFLSHAPLNNLYSSDPVSILPQRTLEHFQSDLPSALPQNTHISLQYPAFQLEPLLFKPDSQSKETQTDHIFCEQCNYPFIMRSNLNNVNNQVSDLKGKSSVEFGANNRSGTSLYSNALLKQPSLDSPTPHEVPKELKEGTTKNNLDYSNEPPMLENKSKETIVNYADINRQELVSDVKDNGVGDYVEDMEEEQCIDISDNTLASCGSNENTIVQKSDDESIKHEFDFLEAHKKHNRRKPSQPIIQTPSGHLEAENSGEDDEMFSKDISASIETHQIDPSMHLQIKQASGNALDKNVERNESIKSTSDVKSVSSVSADYPSHLHFENTSIASESDSFSEKETPLTATAAYQALLGNVSSSKVMQKRQEVTDTESEDEIETALATTVRKSSSISINAAVSHVQKNEEKKDIVPESKPKNETRMQGAIFPGKAQNKLTKKTRKVLGLETSSGSEVELEVKSTVAKKDEDSDEFDFYD